MVGTKKQRTLYVVRLLQCSEARIASQWNTQAWEVGGYGASQNPWEFERPAGAEGGTGRGPHYMRRGAG